jgi:phytoene/squalene synthetase
MTARRKGQMAQIDGDNNTDTIRNDAEPSLAPANGSLPASSVNRLLAAWAHRAADWRQSEEEWRRQEQTEYAVVRMNCCRVRAQLLKEVIDSVEAELERTNYRQPEENSVLCDTTTEANKRK